MTTTGADRTSGLQLAPYIFFFGRCEEALEFYKGVFGGSYELNRNTDGPGTEDVPADRRDKIMHASFSAPGVSFMCSDGRENKTIDPEEGNVSLCIEAGNPDEGQRVFDALAAGGTVVMPYEDAFWGGRFGMINDRFGIQWMVTAPLGA